MTRLDCHKNLRKENPSGRGWEEPDLKAREGFGFYTRNTIPVPELKYTVFVRSKEKDKTGKGRRHILPKVLKCQAESLIINHY